MIWPFVVYRNEPACQKKKFTHHQQYCFGMRLKQGGEGETIEQISRFHPQQTDRSAAVYSMKQTQCAMMCVMSASYVCHDLLLLISHDFSNLTTFRCSACHILTASATLFSVCQIAARPIPDTGTAHIGTDKRNKSDVFGEAWWGLAYFYH